MLRTLGAVFVGIGVAVQLVLIWLLLQHAYSPHSEQRGFEAMGLLMLTAAAALYIVPSTLVAIVQAAKALHRRRTQAGGLAEMVFYTGAALLPIAVVLAFTYPDPHARRDRPTWLDRQFSKQVKPQLMGTTALQKELSGRQYAVDANLFDVARCAHASPEFTHGCREQVYQRHAELARAGGPLPEAAQPTGVLAPDPPIGEKVHQWPAKGGRVEALAFVEGGSMLASATHDGVIQFLPMGNAGAERTHLINRKLWSVAFAPDGAAFAAGDENGLLAAYDARSGAEIWRTQLAGGIVALAYSPDGKWLAAGDTDFRVALHDARNAKQLHVLTGHQDRPVSLAFAPDGGKLMSADLAGDATLWDLGSRNQLHQWKLPPGGSLALAGMSADGRTVVAGSHGTFKLWDVQSGAEVGTVTGEETRAGALAIAPDRSTIATLGIGDAIRLWDTATGRKRGIIDYMPGGEVLAYSLDGRFLAAGDSKGKVTVWRIPAAR